MRPASEFKSISWREPAMPHQHPNGRPVLYSITSSARTRISGEIATPSARAVFRIDDEMKPRDLLNW